MVWNFNIRVTCKKSNKKVTSPSKPSTTVCSGTFYDGQGLPQPILHNLMVLHSQYSFATPVLAPFEKAFISCLTFPVVPSGGLLLQVPPDPVVRAVRLLLQCSLSLAFQPDTQIPCRTKTEPLPRTSILFRPPAYPFKGIMKFGGGAGTAPGSVTIIPYSVYRYSRFNGINIS